MNQRELVERAQRGDQDAFAVLAGASIARLDTLRPVWPKPPPNSRLAGPRTTLLVLVRLGFLDRARPEVAAAEWERIVSAGLDDITFAWAGPDTPGRGHYYAVRGPGFLVEYDNTQNEANHIHAVWRDLRNDWGEDLLGAHYAADHR